MNMSSSIQQLQEYKLVTTAHQAIYTLIDLLEPYTVLQLYQKYFPHQWAGTQAVLRPESEQYYSEAELEFFMLVDVHLFPLTLDYYEMENDRTNYIYLRGEGVGELDDYDYIGDAWYDRAENWRMVMGLAGMADAKDLDIPKEYQRELARLCHLDTELNTDRITLLSRPELLSEINKPLVGLVDALLMLDHSTGNPFFDQYSSDPEWEYCWCEGCMATLIPLYQQAQRIEAKVNNFFDWLDESPANLRKAVKMVNQAREEERVHRALWERVSLVDQEELRRHGQEQRVRVTL